MRRLLSFVLCLLPVMEIPPVRGQESHQRVLFLFPNSDEFPSAAAVSTALRNTLANQSPLKIETFNEFLDLAQFPDAAQRRRAVGHLAERYAQARPDVMLALGPDTLKTAVSSRGDFAPAVPIVFCCVSAAHFSSFERPADATGILSEFNVSETMALAQRLQPDARHLVVIAGAAPFDLTLAQIARGQLRPEDRFDARYLVGLPIETILDEIGRLSRDTIVILLSLIKDGAGRNFAPPDIAEEIARASSAPVYGPLASYLGRGVVGGHMDSFDAIGAQTGELVLRILRGEDPRSIPPQMSTTPAFRVDGRQLERWSLRESDLPEHTVVMYKTASLLDQHPNLVPVASAAVLLQSAILLLMLNQMRGRRRTQRLLTQSEERRDILQDEERARIARDLHDSTAQHLTAIGLALMRSKEETAADSGARDALEDIRGLLKQASKELNAYTYLLHPPSLQRDGLDQALHRYVQEFGRRTGLKTTIRSNDEGRKLSLQLQQSVLRIVQEALANLYRHASASRVSVNLRRVGRRLHLVISDDGGRSKRERERCSLAAGEGMQQIAARMQQYGGTLDVRSRSTGTTVHAVMPLR